MNYRGKGKYFSPVYVAKKYPSMVKKTFAVKKIAVACIAIAVLAAGVIIWQTTRSSSDSFIEVTASGRGLSDVDTYPRIVNESSPIDKSYQPENLVSLNSIPNGESVFLRRDAAESFISMLEAMAKDGLAVLPVKGYTSYQAQNEAMSDSIDKFIAEGCSSSEANKKASELLLNPGEDEAQLGTSIDISVDVNSVESFSSTEQYQWIYNNASKFGFIIRYTADKQDITGVSAKPWHIRYVGVQTAEYMKSNNLCLEEYVKLVQKDNPSAVEEI